MVTSITRRKVIAIILTILIWGLGHAYVGRIKRGVGLFFLGAGIMLGASFLILWPYSVLVGLAYLAWLIYDVTRIIKQENKQSTLGKRNVNQGSEVNNLACQKCGNITMEGSSFCVKCGSPLK